MVRRLVASALALAASGCLHRFVECNDTDTCRAQIAARDRAFARAVADEPQANRVAVEAVSSLALVDRQRQVVYALDPGLVALELGNGRERWRAPAVTGDGLWRAGGFLVAGPTAARQAELTFFDPAEAQVRFLRCTPPLAVPADATTVAVHPFDREGQPYLFWQSSYTYSGGTPPDEAAEEREALAEACGVVRIDPRTCAATPVRLARFLWDPPEGRRRRPGEADFCDFLSPLLDLPAAAAAAPPQPSSSATPVVSVRRETEGRSECELVTHVTLEARDRASALLWSHPLADVTEDRCGPP